MAKIACEIDEARIASAALLHKWARDRAAPAHTWDLCLTGKVCLLQLPPWQVAGMRYRLLQLESPF